MTAISNYIGLTISVNSVGLTVAGFGIPMILSATAAWSQRIRFYTDLNSLATDFPVTTSPEYLAGSALLAQSPAVAQFAIGRSANKPTIVQQLSAVTPTSFPVGTVYTATVSGNGFATQTVTYTSTTATDAAWASAMVTALNAVTGKTFTASGSSSPISATGNAAGNWFSIQISDPNTMSTTLTHSDPGVAADLTAINLENASWYALITTSNSKAFSIAAAAWVEANSKIYGCDTCDTTTITTAAGNGDLMDTIATNTYARTLAFYHPSPAAMACSALFGRCLPIAPGGVTFFGKTLNGLAPVSNLTQTQRNNITAKRGSSYETVGSLNISFGGQVGSPVNNYLDVTRNLDFVQSDMTTSVFSVIAAANIISYTDAGIAIIENEVRGACTRAVAAGIFAATPQPVVTVPTAAAVPSGDKTSRTLNNVKFSATLAGAIHKVNIGGTVSF